MPFGGEGRALCGSHLCHVSSDASLITACGRLVLRSSEPTLCMATPLFGRHGTLKRRCSRARRRISVPSGVFVRVSTCRCVIPTVSHMCICCGLSAGTCNRRARPTSVHAQVQTDVFEFPEVKKHLLHVAGVPHMPMSVQLWVADIHPLQNTEWSVGGPWCFFWAKRRSLVCVGGGQAIA